MSINTSQGLDYVADWIWQIRDIVPPFCVEIVLSDGSRYFLRSVSGKDDQTKSLVIRIWDFRAFSIQEIEDLKKRINQIKSRSELSNEQEIHPKLDWANLHLKNINQIAYCVEWHDRIWPEENRPKIGF